MHAYNLREWFHDFHGGEPGQYAGRHGAGAGAKRLHPSLQIGGKERER